MTVWADADSLPREARELIGRRTRMPAGESAGIEAVFVSNRKIPLPAGENLRAELVAAGDGMADDRMLAAALPGDILVTRDLPLAARAVEAGLLVINDRGESWDAGTVRERLSLRDRAEELRKAGIAAPMDRGRGYGPREARAFAGALDRALAAASRLALSRRTS